MKILSVIPEMIKTAARVLFNGEATDTSDVIGVLPAGGAQSITILCLVTMANAADLVLSLVTGDNADGLNAVALSEVVPVWKDDVRQTDAKGLTIGDASGVFTAVFNVPAILIPTGKFLCLNYANSNAANILSAIALADSYHEHAGA